ncbi:hypothetical protein L596_028539 [Steinernema carpocapsae]|uniref:Uncharacterized protein n=1 Tax=Steinernema carpocapsae TaxID=34508 RepID=A0A4U5LZP1_STECR|nr:hypothetical protein L596_028539 [Steinernema carpocapsae]
MAIVLGAGSYNFFRILRSLQNSVDACATVLKNARSKTSGTSQAAGDGFGGAGKSREENDREDELVHCGLAGISVNAVL